MLSVPQCKCATVSIVSYPPLKVGAKVGRYGPYGVQACIGMWNPESRQCPQTGIAPPTYAAVDVQFSIVLHRVQHD